MHARGVRRRGARGRAAPARAFRCGTARRSTRCSRGCSRCSSIPTSTRSSPTRRRAPGKDILAAERQQPLRRRDDGGPRRVRRSSYPLNSRLVKRDGKLVEEVYRVGGRYGAQIAAIVGHLEAAIPFATEPMADGAARADHVLPDRRGGRPRGVRHRLGAGQGVAGRHDQRLHRGLPGRARHQGRVGSARLLRQPRRRPRRSRSSPRNAQWFEDRMPWDPKYRKQGVQRHHRQRHRRRRRDRRLGPDDAGRHQPAERPGRSASSTAASRCRCRTSTRRTTSRRRPSSAASSRGRRRKPARAEKWSALAGELTTNMHEVIGHASGKIAERLKGNPQSVLKEQFSALEEARADLVALYFLPDPKLVELGLRRRGRSRRDRARRVRGLRAQRARAAAPRPRGHADRRRPHAQPPDDRPLADGATRRRSRCARATARPTT